MGRAPKRRVADEETIDLTVSMLALYYRTHEIKREIERHVGRKVTLQTIRNLERKARAKLADINSRSNDEERFMAIETLRGIIRESEDDNVRIKAIKQLDEMLGLSSKYGGRGDDDAVIVKVHHEVGTDAPDDRDR